MCIKKFKNTISDLYQSAQIAITNTVDWLA